MSNKIDRNLDISFGHVLSFYILEIYLQLQWLDSQLQFVSVLLTQKTSTRAATEANARKMATRSSSTTTYQKVIPERESVKRDYVDIVCLHFRF